MDLDGGIRGGVHSIGQNAGSLSIDASHQPPFVLYIGYQFVPQKLLDQAKATGIKLVYFDVQPAQPPEPAGNILYLDPAWPFADGCVTVPGYDVPILPASGVVQAAIYWTIASERAKLTAEPPGRRPDSPVR